MENPLNTARRTTLDPFSELFTMNHNEPEPTLIELTNQDKENHPFQIEGDEIL